jgi:hypothetical protein
MPTVASYKDVGPKSVPQEVRELRRHSLDFHTRLGQPVIIKRKLTLKDVEEGNAVRCPYHTDEQYDNTLGGCPYCFGTGILGGYADAVITFMAIGDTPSDLWRLTDAGLLQRMEHPQVTSPWFPFIHDGDLIITADFEADDWSVIETHDRYVADVVSPTRMRGAAPLGFATRRERGKLNFAKHNDMVVSHSFELDRLPEGHILYDVPIDDDDVVYPPVPPDPGHDPDDPYTPDVPRHHTLTRSDSIKLSSAITVGGETHTDGEEDVDVFFPEEYS